MSKQTTTPEPTDKRRKVNRNPRLRATAEIVDVLADFDAVTQSSILRAVNEMLASQPELDFPKGDPQT